MREHSSSGAELPPTQPIGAWVVGGFLLFAVLTIWTLAAVIFQVRS
ncbi:MAG: hypothetical protein P4L66_04905 [Acetobacteraceae bacterium]|nr:hypothetical protein [Acetobacteraceae bacterium]